MRKKSKKKLYNLFVTVCIAGFTLLGMSKYYVNKKSVDLVLANIEALADNPEKVPMMNCTRAISYANCYDSKTNEWTCIVITETEDYQVPATSPFLCDHAHVSSCPRGTYQL